MLLYSTKSARVITAEEVEKSLLSIDINSLNVLKEQFGYYLAGLLEGDGSINIPALGNSILKRVLNPRIIFTFHINNLALYAIIQKNLGGIGRFQRVNTNTGRYIIGDYNGIVKLINLIHGKFRTPKNITFNNLIEFINNKYNTNILVSHLDTSNLYDNA
jgi:LAGLIDADG endonuclease